MKKLEKLGIETVSFLQSLGLAIYISAIGILMWNGNKWFPVKGALGPIFVLTLFSVSILICGFLALGYPVYLFWEKKERIKAIRIVAFTTAWLILFLILILFAIAIF